MHISPILTIFAASFIPNLTKTMKKILVPLLLFTLPFIACAYEAIDGYYFDKYFVFIDVHEDNSYSIKESFNTVFTTPKHGIYRSIPNNIWIKRDTTEAQDRSGAVMRTYHPLITDVWVNQEFAVFETDSLVDIRIGSANRLVTDTVNYILTYEHSLYDDRIPQADLFFHSVMGPGNPCTTERFYFRINFDKPIPQSSLDQMAIYRGKVGNSENIARQTLFECTTDSITGVIDQLQPYEAVSVYIPLPEGYFAAPADPDIDKAWFWTGIAALLLLYVLCKELFRKTDVTPVVTFYPPKKTTSAEIGTIFDCSADDQDLISLIPHFANQGYISIRKNNQGHLILHQEQPIDSDAKKYEKTLYDGLFAEGSDFDVTQKTTTQFGRAWLKAKEQLQGDTKQYEDEWSFGIMGILILALIIMGMAIGYADATSGGTGTGSTITMLYLVEAVVMFLLCGEHRTSGCLLTAIFTFLALGVFLSPAYLLPADLLLPRLAVNALLLLGFAASLFTYRLSYMTDARRKRMGEILGLREFIKTADADRLKMLLTEDGRYFYKVLPYAIAFGMADRWARQFARLAVVPSDSIQVDTSTLISVSSLCHNSNFRHGIVAETKRREAAAAAASRHSSSYSSSGSSYSSSSSYSSGGGGYSGGGSGGGGSRSW